MESSDDDDATEVVVLMSRRRKNITTPPPVVIDSIRVKQRMFKVVQWFNFSLQTLFLSFIYLDLFMSRRPVADEEGVYYYGCAALMIAMKFEEVYFEKPYDFPGFDELELQRLCRCELSILEALQCSLRYETLYDYLHDCDYRVILRAIYLAMGPPTKLGVKELARRCNGGYPNTRSRHAGYDDEPSTAAVDYVQRILARESLRFDAFQQ